MADLVIHGRHFPDLNQEVKATVGTAAVYHFRWVGTYSAWAIFTVNDATGEFAIQSDWGNWAHRWNIDALGGGQTLTQFLATCSGPDYITNKLSYGEPRSFTQEVDHEATIRAWKEKVLNARLMGNGADLHKAVAKLFGFEPDFYIDGLDSEQAAEVWHELKRFGERYDLGQSEAEAIVAIGDMFTSYDALYTFLGGNEMEIWESIETRPSWAYTFLREFLLPFFFNYLRENVVTEGKVANG
jgi:hypothetical protein